MTFLNQSSAVKPDQLSLIMQAALGESPQHACELANEWRRYRSVVHGFWEEGASVSLEASLAHADKIQIPDLDLLQHFLNGSKHPEKLAK